MKTALEVVFLIALWAAIILLSGITMRIRTHLRGEVKGIGGDYKSSTYAPPSPPVSPDLPPDLPLDTVAFSGAIITMLILQQPKGEKMERPNAPLRTSVSLPDIQAKIKHASYTLLSDGRTTLCQLTLENGYTVIGTSACVDPKNYNQALGEKYAYEKAIDAVWPLEGYLLAEERFRAGNDAEPKGYTEKDIAAYTMRFNPLLADFEFYVEMKDGFTFVASIEDISSLSPSDAAKDFVSQANDRREKGVPA